MTMQAPFFSVCIPTFNRASQLPAALASALAQTSRDFEVVVVDNASTDGTTEVLRRFPDPRLRVVRNAETVSMYANHNVCVAHAKAPWVVFLHSDDELERDALETLRSRIEARPCDVVYPAKQLHREYVQDGDVALAGIAGVPSLLRWPAGTPSGAAYRRSLLCEMPLDETKIAADWLWLANALRRGARMLVVAKSTIRIGEGAFQYSSNWQKSGAFVSDVSQAFKAIVADPAVLLELERQIGEWTDAEIAFLLMMLSHADERHMIARLQERLSGRRGYMRNRHYRHVVAYKLLGATGLRLCFKTVKLARSIQ